MGGRVEAGSACFDRLSMLIAGSACLLRVRYACCGLSMFAVVGVGALMESACVTETAPEPGFGAWGVGATVWVAGSACFDRLSMLVAGAVCLLRVRYACCGLSMFAVVGVGALMESVCVTETAPEPGFGAWGVGATVWVAGSACFDRLSMLVAGSACLLRVRYACCGLSMFAVVGVGALMESACVTETAPEPGFGAWGVGGRVWVAGSACFDRLSMLV